MQRVLPTRGRRTIGAWCFVDHMGPAAFGPGDGIAVAPHPHIGLQTVTWLFEGSAVHRDSLGSEQRIRPGQLNVMTAGAGIAHSEEDPDGPGGTVHGMQFWIAQPAATRSGPSAFGHHADLPRVDLDHGSATVLVGPFCGSVSPARRDSDHLGVELDLRPGTTVLPLDPTYEHGLVAASGDASLAGAALAPGSVAYLPPGAEELVIRVADPARLVLIGGVPFAEDVTMWWNFVARSREELTDAYRDWVSGSDRFGPVHSKLPRVDVGPPPWLRTV